ncbi:hypothetical protein Enr13x_11020 [Stieleria neptunia]|uniref:Uncharacterized protein n=1 Tax=Stieleria neptunia TaxID=2527979 RepID=A0A518HK92_9BACT|nr:hypothetical protein Enr13x_11020 [Stieleria neptunia]
MLHSVTRLVSRLAASGIGYGLDARAGETQFSLRCRPQFRGGADRGQKLVMKTAGPGVRGLDASVFIRRSEVFTSSLPLY